MQIFSFREKRILRTLSDDSTASVSALAKSALCSRITAEKEVKRLVETYKIRFGIEIDEDALGLFQRHLIIVKFNKKPKLGDIMEIFKNDPYVVDAYMCEGDFELMIYAIANDPMKYIIWETLLSGKLGDYEVNIYPSELMHTNFGYFPVSDSTISRFAKSVNDTDKSILVALAKDSRKSMSGLSRELKVSRTTLYYRVFKLYKSGLIKRFTISVNKPPLDYIIAYVVNYRFNKTSSQRSIRMMDYYKGYDEPLPMLTTFQLLAPMSGSFRFLGIGLFDGRSDAVKNAIDIHKSIFDRENIEIRHARITGLVKGSYPFRNIDISENYTRFRWDEEGLK